MVVAAAGKRVSAVFQQMFKIRLGERRVQLGRTERRETDSFKDKSAADNASEDFISDPGLPLSHPGKDVKWHAYEVARLR